LCSSQRCIEQGSLVVDGDTLSIKSAPEQELEPEPELEPEAAGSLAAFFGAWLPQLQGCLDELGVEEAEDLKELEAEDIEALVSKLKKVQGKKLRKKLAALCDGSAAAAVAAAGAASPVAAAASEPEPEPAAYTVETHGQTVEVMQPTDEFDFVFSNKTASDALCLTIRAKLTERGLRVWQQKTNIPKDSDNWFNEWFPSAVKSRKIVCFISADYLKSPYCMKEFGIALATQKLLVVACEPLAQINAVDPSVYPYASNALAYLLGGGQVIFHDSEDVVAEILKFA